ncbi:MAG: hypothetical protein HKN14_09290 [Marinicaulis sp.]|nr:hypothetical protein [Marinicaulis sp.]NNL88345.1 hypothetical protein [Marinicaulis sp.]
MTEDSAQRVKDAEEHVESYNSIMKAATEFGVPASLGLAMFFTSLVMANGVFLSLFLGIAVHIFSFFVVRTFFSH